jgi:hypothetical protein
MTHALRAVAAFRGPVITSDSRTLEVFAAQISKEIGVPALLKHFESAKKFRSGHYEYLMYDEREEIGREIATLVSNIQWAVDRLLALLPEGVINGTPPTHYDDCPTPPAYNNDYLIL